MTTTAPLLLRVVQRHPITAFVVLACLFGWVLFPLAALGIGSNPSNVPYAPVVAALIVVTCQGRRALASWGRSLLRWRVKPIWYAFAFLTPIALGVLSVGANHLFGAPLPSTDQLAEWPQAAGTFAFMLLAVGLGEEAGWTAFAAPILLRRHTLLRAWVLMAAIRIFWHLPIIITGELPWLLGVAGMLGFQLIVLWLMQANKGQWTLAAVWHASLNGFCGGFLFTMVTGADNARLGVLLGVAYALLGAVFLTPPMRKRANHRQDRLDPLAAEEGRQVATAGPRSSS
jgi:CAAX protease family protein